VHGAVDESEIESMVNKALSVAKVDVTENYVHTSCIHAATHSTSAAVAHWRKTPTSLSV